ncbi:MAG: NADH-quinone oxidoreductase subunit L [Parvibaculum sp.]|uniref:NADH-quinone oxidoreductase subunit L n=1 Tax=Parvibaculum sp. TaxID=2024848 RepID=UPI003C759796
MYSAIVFLPLLGFLIAGIFGRWLGVRGAQFVTSGLLVVSAVLSIIAFPSVTFGGVTEHIQVMTWIDSGAFESDWRLRIDALTAVMLVVVTSVSALVHIYSIGYMSHDPHQPRFFAYLSLFTFAMLMLVTADNFIQLFFGWEGVGLASYLLIGFWYQKPSANAAAIKAFVVNRVGDFGLILGIATIFMMVGSVEFDTVFKAIPHLATKTFSFLGHDVPVVTTICLLLFMGAMGKSAQFMLHTWLPDAMEGPTPVSALIHAATMVTAGVFLVARCSPIFEFSTTALTVVTFIGATTAFFAATVGLVQNDIKRVIAYSTCSQLGYMFAALGVGAYEAAMFHLFTHAFFKALLFLGSGSVIHAMSDEQDMRKMGGLWKRIPATYAMMVIGTLALTGFPFTAGYFSKDAIIEATYAGTNSMHMYAFGMTVFAALLTSFYSWRLIFMTFHGKSRADHHTLEHVHESPLVMLVPLVILAVGALGAGLIFERFFIGEAHETFWLESIYRGAANTVMHDLHHIPSWAVLLPTIMMALGFAISWYFYIARPDLPAELARTQEPLYKFLLNKWYIDELYDWIIVKPAFAIGRLFWKIGDGRIIDGLGPDGVSARVIDITRGVVRLQTGYVFHYAFAMLLGVAALATYFMLGGVH